MVARDVFLCLDSSLKVKMLLQDGNEFHKNTSIMTIQGKTASLLASERTALNFLSFLSGIASAVSEAAQILAPSKIKVLDTRKTLPGLRTLSKYAVRAGGGLNHRENLEDQGLIKDNHLALYENIKKAVIQLKREYPKLPSQVEVDNLEQLESALSAEPDHILLDNMNPRLIKKCVKRIKEYSIQNQKKIYTEASGGIHPGNLKGIKKTGVDFVSMSSITMNAKPIDFSLKIENSI